MAQINNGGNRVLADWGLKQDKKFSIEAKNKTQNCKEAKTEPNEKYKRQNMYFSFNVYNDMLRVLYLNLKFKV